MNENIYFIVLPCLLFLTLFLVFHHKHKYVLALIFKSLATIAVISYLILQINWISRTQHEVTNIMYSIFIYIALGFIAIGDILFSVKDLCKKKTKEYISFAGVVTFFLGYASYLIQLFKILLDKEHFYYFDVSKVYIPVLSAVTATLLISLLIYFFIKKKMKEKIILMIYVLAISLLVAISCYNMISSIKVITSEYENMKYYFIVTFITCLMFFISNIILIFNSNNKHPKAYLYNINIFIHYFAELLIGLSLFFFYI